LTGNLLLRNVLYRRQRFPVSAGALAPPLVDQPSCGGLDQPPARFLGDAVSRPAPRRCDLGVLDGVLGALEVAVPANKGAEDLRRQLAQQVLNSGLPGQRSPPAVCR
jgi:hypothetical protein